MTSPEGGGEAPARRARVLHVVVGHRLPVYFANAVRSVRFAAASDRLLVIDNASPEAGLRDRLRRLAEEDDHVELVLRGENDARANGKVGSLYAAYAEAFAYAIEHGYELLHLLQGDMQTLWWDDDVVERARKLFAAHPACANLYMNLLPRDKALTDELVASTTPGVWKLRKYGLSDTGLYDVARWQAFRLSFGSSERGHGARFLSEGLEVLCHPLATDAAIPWPAVVRDGVRKGREVRATRPFLLRPAGQEEIRRLKEAREPVWLEDVCVPWGWSCLTPMWTTGLESADYFVLRFRDARRRGLQGLVPRIDRRGAEATGLLGLGQFRPPLARLLVAAPFGELRTRLRAARAALSAGQRRAERPSRARRLLAGAAAGRGSAAGSGGSEPPAAS